MANVIDTLVVELALDARNLNQQTNAALQNFKNLQEQSKRSATEAETQGKKVLEFFGDLKRSALGIGALLLGGMGVKEFASFITNLDAATGRVAKTMNITGQELSAWEQAFQQLGASTGSATATLQTLSSEVHKYGLTGQSGLLAPLTQLGIRLRGANGELKTSTELFHEIIDAVQGMPPERARAIMSMLGMDQDAVNVALQGNRALEERLGLARKMAPTDDDIKRAQEFQDKMAKTEQAATGLSRVLFNIGAPGLTALLEKMTDVLIKLKENFNKPAEPNGRGGVGGLMRSFGTVVDFGSLPLRLFGIPSISPMIEKYWPRGSNLTTDADRRGQQLHDETVGGTGSRGDRNNNPGNIKMGPVARKFGAVSQDDQGHAIVPSWEAGDAAQAELLRRSYSGLTLQEIGSKYAEDPHWAAAVSQYSGFGLAQIPDLSDPSVMAKFQAAIRRQEGTHAPAGYVPSSILRMPMPPLGAPAAAMTNARTSMLTGSSSRGGGSDHSTHITTGDIHVHAPGARDTEDIAGEIGGAIRRQAELGSWNTGLA